LCAPAINGGRSERTSVQSSAMLQLLVVQKARWNWRSADCAAACKAGHEVHAQKLLAESTIEHCSNYPTNSFGALYPRLRATSNHGEEGHPGGDSQPRAQAGVCTTAAICDRLQIPWRPLHCAADASRCKHYALSMKLSHDQDVMMPTTKCLATACFSAELIFSAEQELFLLTSSAALRSSQRRLPASRLMSTT